MIVPSSLASSGAARVDNTVHVQWPASRFYWSVLEAPGFKRGYRGPVPDGLLLALVDDLPVPLDQVHAVSAVISPGKLLVAAIDRDAFAQLPSGALSLTPESIPECRAWGACGESQNDAHNAALSLNLVTGEFEPQLVRQTRSRTRRLAAAAVLVTALLVSTGLLRRDDHWRAQAELARSETNDTIRAAWALARGGQDAKSPVTLDAFTLKREVAKQRESRAGATPTPKPLDVTTTLASVLNGWPAQVSSQAQSIAVGPTGASIAVTVEGDSSPFLQALQPPAGWIRDEPRLNTAGPLTRLSLRLRPADTTVEMGGKP